MMTNAFGGTDGLASSLGPKDGIVAGYPSARSYVVISKSGMNKGVVLHELGHVAGLGHEHIHPEAKPMKSCPELKPQRYTGFEYESYDAKSIMSYCALAPETLMSSNDVALLKRLYP